MGFKLFLLLEKFLMVLPSSLRKGFFSSLATLGYLTSSRYKKVSHQNLDFVFNNTLSEDKKDEITKYAFKNLAFNFLHAMELRHMSKDDLQKRITIQNIEAVQKVHAEGRAVIYVTTHYSSWELGGASIGAFIEPLIAVYKKMKNQAYEEWLLEARDKFGNISMEKSNVVKPLVRNLKKGLACGLLIDTNINKKEGLVINFMGQTLRQTSTPAFLARKFDAAIIPVTIRTDDDEGFTEVGNYSPSAMVLGFSYAKMLSQKFAIGANLKYVRQSLGSGVVGFNTDGSYKTESFATDVFAFDFGLIYRTGFKSLNIGMSISNFSEEIKFIEEGFQLPLLFKLGASMDMLDFFDADKEMHSLLLSLDATHPRDYPEQILVGAEYIFLQSFAIRAGYKTPTDIGGFSAGAGVKVNLASMLLGVDYSYAPADVFDSLHRIAVKFAF